jgi:hypothetical protein
MQASPCQELGLIFSNAALKPAFKGLNVENLCSKERPDLSHGFESHQKGNLKQKICCEHTNLNKDINKNNASRSKP